MALYKYVLHCSTWFKSVEQRLHCSFWTVQLLMFFILGLSLFGNADFSGVINLFDKSIVKA